MAQTSFSLKYETEFTERYASQFYEGPVEKLLEQMRDAAGKAMRGVIQQFYITQGVGRKTGNLYKSINAKKIRRQPGTIGVIAAAMGKGSNHRHLIEYGTKSHLVRPRDTGALRLAFGFSELVQHPGGQAKPFVTPSTQTAQEAGQQAADEVLGKYIERANSLNSVEAA
jgi:hypothetical protein